MPPRKKPPAQAEGATDLFGNVLPPVVEEEVHKNPSISPFDFVNAIHHSKVQLIVDEWSERQYNPYIINRALSYGSDTVIQANEMNARAHIPKKAQFQFLLNTIRPRKRFNKWLKAEPDEALDTVKAYYGYSTDKARQALRLLTPEQLEYIRAQLDTGGMRHGT